MLLAQFLKAIAGLVTAFGTGLITAATEGGISSGEWYAIIGGALVAGAAVWTVPNKVPPDDGAD
jgi:hypothetical protein